jgi:hypothetical protein
MARTLKILFRRDPSKDRQDDKTHFEGYEFRWPDGRPVTVGLDALCTHGQRLFGLGRHLQECPEKLLEVLLFPLAGRDADMTKLPGHRVRRFFIERTGGQGRVHFIDGTPTAIVFEIGRDEAPVLHWIGLPQLCDGERQWFDLAAQAAQSYPVAAPLPAFVNHSIEQLA